MSQLLSRLDLLDLSITLMSPPAGSSPEVLATLALRCDQLGLSHTGDLLIDPLMSQERADLHWYLEEYWKWPYDGFAQRGKRIEELLPQVGKRLYKSVFGSFEANSLLQAWRLQPESQRQISIIGDFPKILSLPWELLHDEQGFLVLRTRRPVVLVRRLPQAELVGFPTAFEPPLRILLVTARPDEAGFIDPRSIARELLDAVQEQVKQGTIDVEFLRPPTLRALRARLSDAKRPSIHILHFDGHGTFRPDQISQDGLVLSGQGQGLLAFEDENGQLDLVKAKDVAQVLQDSGVRLAVLNACQSAVSSDEAMSSVASHLIQGGLDAVVSMSASVLVACATRYVEAFYHELAAGTAVTTAQERARQALHDDPRRHFLRRSRDKEGTPIELRDWWLPHFYQQRPLLLQPTKPVRKRKQQQTSTSMPRLNKEMPKEPRYGFGGRSRELLQLERCLTRGKLVVISGFGGIGKTALVREAADWLTRTKMYEGACFVSFEQGYDATWLLGELGRYLNIYGSTYDPSDKAMALAQLKSQIKARRILVIADNLESILPAGETPLDPTLRTQLWDILLDLAQLGAGVLLTSRDTAFGDGRLALGANVAGLSLAGLSPDDAYALAIRVLTDLGIDRRHAPYAELRDLLLFLDNHPLAIQLVLPTLRQVPLVRITAEFVSLLSKFEDDTTAGRNRSLLASLEYSLQRLSPEQRTLLPRLALFEGGANEDSLLDITEIPEREWAKLRPILEQAALLTVEQVHEAVAFPFLHFHPVLAPYLRSQPRADDPALRERYRKRYYAVVNYLYHEDERYPQPVRAVVQRELPNLRRALELLLEEGELATATTMATCIAWFLNNFGLYRERDELQRQVSKTVAGKRETQTDGTLLEVEYLLECNRGENEYVNGNLQAAYDCFAKLLARIEAQSEGTPLGRGGYEHCLMLTWLARCLREGGQPSVGEARCREALAIIEALINQQPENESYIKQRGALQGELGKVLGAQGKYPEEQEAFEAALRVAKQQADVRGQAVTEVELGMLALRQRNYAEAQSRYTMALARFHTLDEPAAEAGAWHQLGRVAQEQKKWAEAERCYRESLALEERLDRAAGAARTCNQLAMIAGGTGRPNEAEGWYRRALELFERVRSGGLEQAMILNNLAVLLVNEVHAGAPVTRLAEARDYAEQAQAIEETLDASVKIWIPLNILAQIAEMEGRTDAARDYRRRERVAYAAFTGNRYDIDQQFGTLIINIVAAAKGDTQARGKVEAVLQDFSLKEKGVEGQLFPSAIRRIWAGERDWQALVEGFNNAVRALLVLQVLETLAQPMGTQSNVDD